MKKVILALMVVLAASVSFAGEVKKVEATKVDVAKPVLAQSTSAKKAKPAKKAKKVKKVEATKPEVKAVEAPKAEKK